jgi:hypothetical protein
MNSNFLKVDSIVEAVIEVIERRPGFLLNLYTFKFLLLDPYAFFMIIGFIYFLL